MKKSELIQCLAQYQADDAKVLGLLLFKGQDSEAITRLKAILQSSAVATLASEAELPALVVDTIKKVIAYAKNADPNTQVVIKSLNLALSQRGASAASDYFTTRPNGWSFFHDMGGCEFNNIMQFLSESDAYALSVALSTTKESEQEKANGALGLTWPRYLAHWQRSMLSKPIKELLKQFLQAVSDADLTTAKAILKSAKSKPWLLNILLRASNERGNALSIAIHCWDWVLCEGGKPAMAETLMEYMRLLPGGESLIDAQMQALFPKGIKTHQQEQEKQAAEFAKTILEPLAELINNASDEEIKFAYGLTKVKNEEVDTYIATYLAGTKFWESLMKTREAIKTFMQKSQHFNPYLLQQAFSICLAKYKRDKWQDRPRDRFKLLSIHAIGGIQAFSPRLVQMLFARGGIYYFYEMQPDERKNFNLARSTEFANGGGAADGCSAGGQVLAGLKYLLEDYWMRFITVSFCRLDVGHSVSSDWSSIVKLRPAPWKSYVPRSIEKSLNTYS